MGTRKVKPESRGMERWEWQTRGVTYSLSLKATAMSLSLTILVLSKHDSKL